MKKKIRKISVLVLIGMLVGVGLVGMIPTAVAGTENLPWYDNFEDGNDDGWTRITGSWYVSNGEYIQSDSDDNGGKTDYGYEMISVLTTPPTTNDYIIQVRMKQDFGYEYYAGFVFRYEKYQNIPIIKANYYLLILGVWYGTYYLEFWTCINEMWDSLAEVQVDVDLTEWNTLAADIKGDNFDFYLNGDHVLGITDSQLSTGTVGLYTEWTKVRFDDWGAGIPEDTPVGINVPVDSNPYVNLIFSQVNELGDTTVMAYSGPYLANFRLTIYDIPWEYYHITTIAAYTGVITVGITFTGTHPDLSDIDIEHWQGNQWVDITVSRDILNKIIYGEISSVFHLGTEPPLAMPAGGLTLDIPYYDDFSVSGDPLPDWTEMMPGSEWSAIGDECHQTNRYEWYNPDPYSSPYEGIDHIAYIETSDMDSLTDYVIQVKTKQEAPLPQYHGGTGLVFRYVDELNYYKILLELYSGSHRLTFSRYANGYVALRGRMQITDPTFSLLDWHTITADVQGNKFDFYLDGNFAFQVTDSTFSSGTVGLYTEYAHGVFDDWTCSFPELTTSGHSVEVNPYPDVSVTFSEVPSGGEGVTTAIPSAEYPGPDLGNFFLGQVGNFYDISTTAAYSGPIIIGLPYPDGVDPTTLFINHWQGNLWVPLPTVDINYGEQIIYCEVSSLSWFVVGYLTIDPPMVTITGPPSGSVFPLDTPIPFTASFTDTDEGDTHTALWKFESGGNIISVPGSVAQVNGGGTVSDDISFINAGVYTVTLTVTDSYGLEGTAITVEDLPAFVVIYDPVGGFVTGGGWINSQPGAYRNDPSLIGKATFGFVAKYKKGAQVPTGQTEFKFKVADLNFHSDNYEWLVVAGAKAQFKGTGTINGEGEYKFLLWATDGALLGAGGEDKFRMKIWQEDGDGNEDVVYDNGEETSLGGGQIVIHKS